MQFYNSPELAMAAFYVVGFLTGFTMAIIWKMKS
jgi:hypothetical protein